MGQKKKNSTKNVQKTTTTTTEDNSPTKKTKKQTHKSKVKEGLISNTIQKKTKSNMKSKLQQMYLDKKVPSRYTPEQIEERREYIRNTIIKSNQQFKEDLNSQWYSEHSSANEDYSSTPLFSIEVLMKDSNSLCHESSDYDRSQLQQNQSQLQQQQQNCQNNNNHNNFGGMNQQPRHVSFSNQGEEVHHLQVDRVPPGRDNPIFDIKKTWITELMSKKPKKSSIKISVDRKTINHDQQQFCQINNNNDNNNYEQQQLEQQQLIQQQNELYYQQYFYQDMNIDPTILLDNTTYRVLYEENNQHYVVNTLFSYTQE